MELTNLYIFLAESASFISATIGPSFIIQGEVLFVSLISLHAW